MTAFTYQLASKGGHGHNVMCVYKPRMWKVYAQKTIKALDTRRHKPEYTKVVRQVRSVASVDHICCVQPFCDRTQQETTRKHEQDHNLRKPLLVTFGAIDTKKSCSFNHQGSALRYIPYMHSSPLSVARHGEYVLQEEVW